MRGFVFVSLLLLCGCGARGGLLVEGPDAGAAARRDAGARDAGPPPPRRDAGRPMRSDAGPPELDAGPPPTGCRLVERLGPTTIFRERGRGAFNVPQVEIRDGLIDVFATFVPTEDDRSPIPYGDRVDFSFVSAAPVSGPTRPSSLMRTAVLDGTLGVCLRDLPSRDVALVRFEPDGTSSYDELVFGPGECAAVAGHDGRWFVARTLGDGPSAELVWSVFDRDVEPITMPVGFFSEPSTGARVAVTGYRDRFAWIATRDRSREALVGLARDFDVERFTVEDLRGAPGGPAIAPWPFAPRRLMVAAWSGGLRVIVLDPDRRREQLRSEPLAFAMYGEFAPALVDHPAGAIVASLGYGDLAPNGFVSVISVDSEGREVNRVERFTEREDFGPIGGIDMATDGDAIVVHWAEIERADDGAITPVTRAMILGCE